MTPPPDPAYTLHQGQAADQAACYALLQRNMQPYFTQYGIGLREAAFAQSWTQGHPWVLRWRDTRLAGFYLSLPAADHVFLHTIQIDPRHRLRGLGTWLMAQFAGQSQAAGYRELRLAVYADNPARYWYQRLGYGRVGEAYVQMEMRRDLR